MKRVLSGLVFLCIAIMTLAQQPVSDAYFPSFLEKSARKFVAEAYYRDDANSNSFTNEFFGSVNNSEFLSDELKDRQIGKLDGSTLTGRIRRSGVDALIYSGKGRLFYYAGIDFQQVLDSRIDPDLIRLLLKGNKPYAGRTLHVDNSEYLNIYFNRIKGGVGIDFGNGNVKQTFAGIIGFTSGQNYDWVKVTNSSFCTHPDGDYLDAVISAETKSSDTVWGKLFDINGIGLTADFQYSVLKEKDFYIGINFRNIGFVNWNGNTFSGSIDTTFRFEGFANDTSNNQQIPTDYSYSNLRRLIFKNPENSAFTELLPLAVNATAGKFFGDDKFYAGINAFYYPTLISNYKIELFGTWNYNERFRLTPVIGYSRYSKLNFGLAAGLNLGNNFIIRGGSSYLNTLFSKEAPVGKGGFVSLIFIR